MKKTILMCLSIVGLTFGTGVTVLAAHQTVEHGASWNYGRGWNYAYSNVTSSTHWHSSSVTRGEDSSSSGDTKPGVVSKASIGAWPWDGEVNYYYNVW